MLVRMFVHAKTLLIDGYSLASHAWSFLRVKIVAWVESSRWRSNLDGVAALLITHAPLYSTSAESQVGQTR